MTGIAEKYLPTIAWRTWITGVVQIDAETYQVNASPIDVNEPGAATREIGNYLKDFVGHTYRITASDANTVTIVDDFAVGVGPQSGRQGVVYKSVTGGNSPYLAPVYYRHLDRSALDYSRRWELDILFRQAKHLEVGKLTDLASRTVEVTFDAVFAEVPAGLQNLKVYRWAQVVAGKYRPRDVQYYFNADTDLTVSGFTLQIEASESLTGVIVEYLFHEKYT